MRYWVWALLAVPAALILYQFQVDAISYGEVIHRTGYWSVGFLIAAMSATPLQRALGARVPAGWLTSHRRAIGVASFGYAALHTGVYLERKWGAGLILQEGLEPELATGWIALCLFLILAATSNDVSVRALGKRWKAVHRFVYPAAGLTFAHWILATFDPVAAYVCLSLLILIELLRLMSAQRRQSSQP